MYDVYVLVYMHVCMNCTKLIKNVKRKREVRKQKYNFLAAQQPSPTVSIIFQIHTGLISNLCIHQQATALP